MPETLSAIAGEGFESGVLSYWPNSNLSRAAKEQSGEGKSGQLKRHALRSMQQDPSLVNLRV